MKREELSSFKNLRQPPKAGALVSNVRLVDVQGEAKMSSPFASMGYQPDNWKAYLEFDICHALPSWTGPVWPGNYIAYYPDTLAASHGSLVHQQLNLRHLIKAYDPENIAQDRIIGCVVATSFPKPPMGGYKVGTDADAAPAISVLACVFKLAQGVNTALGNHQASREKQSVSIETITPHTNIGVLRPSTGELVPILDPTDEFLNAMSKPPKGYSTPIVGKVDGEQLLLVYGMEGNPIEFQGVGMTPRPAEQRAKITSVRAEADHDMVAIRAESVLEAVIGKTVGFNTGRTGIIESVTTDGRAKLPRQLWSIKASQESPVLTIKLPDGSRILRPMLEVGNRIK